MYKKINVRKIALELYFYEKKEKKKTNLNSKKKKNTKVNCTN